MDAMRDVEVSNPARARRGAREVEAQLENQARIQAAITMYLFRVGGLDSGGTTSNPSTSHCDKEMYDCKLVYTCKVQEM
jgi:hypothetical protein